MSWTDAEGQVQVVRQLRSLDVRLRNHHLPDAFQQRSGSPIWLITLAPGTKFMAGEPMKLATKRLIGWS